MEQFAEVGRGLLMEDIVSEEKNFELDPLWNRTEWNFI